MDSNEHDLREPKEWPLQIFGQLLRVESLLLFFCSFFCIRTYIENGAKHLVNRRSNKKRK